MRVPDSHLEAVHRDGFGILPGFLSDDEVAAARAGLFEVFPSPDDYFADPERYAHLVAHSFAGLRRGPLDSWDVDRIAFHPDLVDAAERFCGTADLELYKVELWAKYSGSVDYDQTLHRDFGNHSLVVPRRDGRWPQFTNFILLSDVTEADGPTKVVSRAIGDTRPLIPRHCEPGEYADREVPVVGPAGTLFSYTSDVLHRASAMTGERRARFALLADYAARGNPWMGKMSWPGRALHPGFTELMERASVRERALFGFPPPGSPYWNDQTLHDVGLRYPNMDMAPYADGVGV